MYLSGRVDTDIYILNCLHDYELLPVLLVNKTIANIVKMHKFWTHRIMYRLKSVVDEKKKGNCNYVETYQKRKLTCAFFNGYSRSEGATFSGLKFAIDVDLKLTQPNLDDLLRPSYKPTQRLEDYHNLFKELPDKWYDKLRSETIEFLINKGELPSKFELSEYLKYGNNENTKIFFDNLLYGNISTKYQSEPRLSPGRRIKFDEIIGLFRFLLENNIIPDLHRIKIIFECKWYLNKLERSLLKSLFEEHKHRFDEQQDFFQTV